MKLFHIGNVVLHLLHIGHSRQHHKHMIQTGRKTDGPGRRGEVRVTGFQNILQFSRKARQRAALDRLHHNHQLAVFFTDLIAVLCRHIGGVPIKIVELKLDVFQFRVFG